MKKLKPALDAIFHKLSENQVQGADYCSRCKNAFNGNHCQIIKVGNYVLGCMTPAQIQSKTVC